MSSKRVRQSSKPGAEAEVPAVVPKKRPRGKPFEAGNTAGVRYPPGVSGNPGGMPKGAAKLSAAMRRWLGQPWRDKQAQAGMTNADGVAIGIGARALQGDVPAAKMIADRTEGRPPQSITVAFDERERMRRAVESIMQEAEVGFEEAVRAFAKFEPNAVVLLDGIAESAAVH
jgi:hypothetical protein